LLRPCRERPRSRRATEKRDELATFQAAEQREWNGEDKHLGSLEVDDQLNFRRLTIPLLSSRWCVALGSAPARKIRSYHPSVTSSRTSQEGQSLRPRALTAGLIASCGQP
jgi:hypothetical protein